MLKLNVFVIQNVIVKFKIRMQTDRFVSYISIERE
ncbi:unnamed protein product [Paramecium sonneborni]|uniref:Uncharacterized protein n=1 Tax=Paramecium sonneborni TaxID=65129 RepID=A0A8S1PP22_9CILI|nr:unnamed protein product [Paramecium sonneborni]